MTLEEFTIEIQKLFDLREEKKTGEPLTEAEYKKLGYFKEILNDFYKAKNSTEGLTREVRKALADRYEVANALYLAKEGDMLIILFGGGTKRGQQRDIDKAKVLLAEYKARKKQKR